jgi:hypothetical protein
MVFLAGPGRSDLVVGVVHALVSFILLDECVRGWSGRRPENNGVRGVDLVSRRAYMTVVVWVAKEGPFPKPTKTTTKKGEGVSLTVPRFYGTRSVQAVS